MKTIFVVLVMFVSLLAKAQDKKTYFPAWTYHQDNVNIVGVSVGVSLVLHEEHNISTQGLKLTLFGEGLLMFWAPSSPVVKCDSQFNKTIAEQEETVNGISISGTGSYTSSNINGLSIAGFAKYENVLNGVSISPYMNFAQEHNGVQFAAYLNEVYKMRGLQIGGRNKSKNTRGIQIGIWNTNERRSLPFINWNFKRV